MGAQFDTDKRQEDRNLTSWLDPPSPLSLDGPLTFRSAFIGTRQLNDFLVPQVRVDAYPDREANLPSPSTKSLPANAVASCRQIGEPTASQCKSTGGDSIEYDDGLSSLLNEVSEIRQLAQACLRDCRGERQALGRMRVVGNNALPDNAAGGANSLAQKLDEIDHLEGVLKRLDTVLQDAHSTFRKV